MTKLRKCGNNYGTAARKIMPILILAPIIICFSIIFNPVEAQQFAKSTIFDEHSSWQDLSKECVKAFKCLLDPTTSWDNNSKSLKISTLPNNTNPWSWLFGKQMPVSPGKDYQVLTHMKLNEWANASHIIVEGLNATSNQWYQLIQCPSATNGPLEWHEYSCKITIPEVTSLIRPVLNAGPSSQSNKQGITWFGVISVTPLDNTAVPMIPGGDSAAKNMTANGQG